MDESDASATLEIPFLLNFQTPLTVHTAIIIEGSVPDNASTFRIDFGAPIKCCCFRRVDDVALSVSPNFDRRYILRNSKHKTQWETEEITGNTAFPLNRGSVFCIEIFTTGKEFLIAVNSVHYCSFQYRVPLSAVKSLEIEGNVQLRQVSIKNEDNQYPHPWVCECGSKVEHFYTLNNIIGSDSESGLKIPAICSLSRSLESGDVITIEGRVKMLPYSFIINVQNSELQWPHPIILLHINGRYSYSQKTKKKDMFVFNSWANNKWGNEKLATGCSLPMPGTVFTVRIVCCDDHFDIVSNRTEKVHFPYRIPLQNAKALCIIGDIHVRSVILENS